MVGLDPSQQLLGDGRALFAAPQPGVCAGPVAGRERFHLLLLLLPPIGAAGGGGGGGGEGREGGREREREGEGEGEKRRKMEDVEGEIEKKEV